MQTIASGFNAVISRSFDTVNKNVNKYFTVIS